MYYIVAQQSPRYHQITMEEFLEEGDIFEEDIVNWNFTNTITYEREEVSEYFLKQIEVEKLIQSLKTFNEEWDYLRKADRPTLYHSFQIPKKTGGFRKIDAPKDDLMTALRDLSTLFHRQFNALYHTSAFAYMPKRCTKDALVKHQQNKSKWFGKFDLSDFFGSTTLEFIMKQLSCLFPFSEVAKVPEGRTQLELALELGFLNGGLPQGTPLSPLLTNLIMIPIDYTMNKWCCQESAPKIVYTRYADDFILSSKYEYDVKAVEGKLMEVLRDFQAPFTLNKKKTRYGSSHGSNWNLGLMLNKDNEITIGHKKKKQFQAALHNYAMDKKNGVTWSLEDIQVLNGLASHYKSVEKEAVENIITHISKKTNLDIRWHIKEDLRNL